MTYFMKRRRLTMRKPEKRSKHRNACFNRTNVKKFHDNIADAQTRLGPFEAHQIWNLDETGCLTVQDPSMVVTRKGAEHVGAVTSAERGQLVTVIACVNAAGNHTPPGIVFPRVVFKDHMIKGAPPGSMGAANPSGWSNEHIEQFLDHVIKHVRPSREQRCLLVLDNHETHLSVKAVEKASQNGIVMLTFPPHTSDKLQPLDVSVFHPFKHYYNRSLEAWHFNNPGKVFSIHDVAQAIGEAFLKAFTPLNIMSGFRSKADQNSYLARCIEKVPLKTASKGAKKNRTHGWKYSLPLERGNYPVCKFLVLKLLKITDKKMRVVYAKILSDSSFSDLRGKHENHPHKFNSVFLQDIDNHLASIPSRPSHYTNSTKRYFDNPDLDVRKLYTLFLDYYFKLRKKEAKIAYSTYVKIFRQKGVYRFKKPKTDVCDYCVSSEIVLAQNPDDPCKTDYLVHSKKVRSYMDKKKKSSLKRARLPKKLS